jgi:site-specific DNA-cytosine methylase
MKFGVIQPLIGGIGIGASQALGVLPEWVIGNPEFYETNEKHYHEYLKEKDWKGIWTNDWKILPDVDMIVSLPVCKGLSQASPTASPDSVYNNQMVEITDFALSKQKPKFFIFENAPLLSREFGKPVADKLYRIAKKNKYSLLLFYTKAKFYGIPQTRPRTYAIFRKDGNHFLDIPVLHEKTFDEFCKEQKFEDSDEMSRLFALKEKPSDHLLYKILSYLTGITDHRKLVEHSDKPNCSLVTLILQAGHDLDTLIQRIEEKFELPEKERKFFNKIIERRKNDRNFWDHRLCFVSNSVGPSFITRASEQWIHPFEDRYLNVREMLRLMSMPDDFNLRLNPSKRKSIHLALQCVSQNVCPNIVSAIIDAVLSSKLKHKSNYIVQEHKPSRIYFRDIEEKTLEEFV